MTKMIHIDGLTEGRVLKQLCLVLRSVNNCIIVMSEESISYDTLNAGFTQAAIEMHQICCSYFPTSIACVWTVETRCFLTSSNTGKNQTHEVFCPWLYGLYC